MLKYLIFFISSSVYAQTEQLELQRIEKTVEKEPPKKFDIGFDGYMRLNYSTFTPERFFGVRTSSEQNNPENPNVGRNDGFGISDARINMRGTFGGNLYVRLGFDLSQVVYTNDNNPIGNVTMGVKDAYARYTFSPKFVLFGGRFKPPYDVEELTPLQSQMFINRSLESRGVIRHEGFSGDMKGFAPGRQFGLMLSSDKVASLSGMNLGYAVAVTNGNSGLESLNDNDLPAFWGRLTLALDMKRGEGKRGDEEGPSTYKLSSDSAIAGLIGLGGFYNEQTYGDSPNQFQDKVYGAGFDAAFKIYWFDVSGQVLWDHTTHVDVGDSEDSLGAHVQLSYRLPWFNLAPSYRFAFYNPRMVQNNGVLQIPDYDSVMHHTAALRYIPKTLPLVFWMDYTHSVEQGGRALNNDRVELAMQVTFP